MKEKLQNEVPVNSKFEKKNHKVQKFLLNFLWFVDKIKLISYSQIRNSIIHMTLICSEVHYALQYFETFLKDIVYSKRHFIKFIY